MRSLVTLPNLCALAVILSLTAYVVLAGADFGGGVWDLLASGPRKREQRELIAHAIGPIWEANHVWLILVIVLLFMCFPPAFAALMTYLHVPLTLMLIGIVLRGCAFAFRAYGVRTSATEKTWGRVFSSASLVTPLLLGACIGAIAAGAVGSGSLHDGVYALYFAPWLAPFSLACGVLALALFTFLAAVYLCVDAPNEGLREEFRVRALWSAGVVCVVAFGALAVSSRTAPAVERELMHARWTGPVQLATAATAIAAILALWTRRFRLARIAAAGQASLILWGWVATQYPVMIPNLFTIEQAAAPSVTLRLALDALVAGAVVLFPSLWYLFRVFKGGDAPT